MLDVERWAELRREHFVRGVSIKELQRRTGLARNTIRAALRSDAPPVRPLFVRTRTHQRTIYRPGEICQWDLWEPSAHVPVGHGQTRRAWVVVACLGYSRAGAGALVLSKQAPDVLWGMSRCLFSLGALPRMMVWDREGCLHAGGGRPTEAYAAFCGQLLLDWYFCEAAKWMAKTDCSSGYRAWECKQYGSSKAVSPAPAVVIEELVSGA